jgi:DNA polymerase III sliding clamp (beta) subunit (PCNA family)
MKTNQKNLETALKILAMCSDPKASLDILSGVRILTQRTLGIVTLQTCNLETGMQTALQAEYGDGDESDFDVVINVKALKAMFGKSTPEAQIEITSQADGYSTVITTANSNRLPNRPGDDFPNIEIIYQTKKLLFGTWSHADLYDALEFCDRAISEDETRPHINSVMLEKGGKMISTDGHRMHIAKSGITDFGPYGSDLKRDSILIPAKASSILLKLLTDDPDEQFEIHGNEDSLRFEIGNYTFHCKNLVSTAEFPPYMQVLPDYMKPEKKVTSEFYVTLNTDSLFDAIKATRKAQGKDSVAEILVNGDFRIKADHPDKGETISTVEVIENTHKKEHYVFGIKLAYLFDGLDNFSDNTRIDCENSNSPIVITSADQQGDPDYIAMVMPCRISEATKEKVAAPDPANVGPMEEDSKMKKVINGKLYDTETAELIGTGGSNGRSRTDFQWCDESLYKTKNGRFFLAGYGGPMTRYSRGGEDIIPLTEKEALQWCEDAELHSDTIAQNFNIEEA